MTFALCLLGRERWRKFPVFFAFQTLGAFLGAAIIFGMYYGEGWRHRVHFFFMLLCCYCITSKCISAVGCTSVEHRLWLRRGKLFSLHLVYLQMPCGTNQSTSTCRETTQLASSRPTLENISQSSMASLIRYTPWTVPNFQLNTLHTLRYTIAQLCAEHCYPQ